MSEQSDRFRSPKLDQSPYFFHFIKGTEADAKNHEFSNNLYK